LNDDATSTATTCSPSITIGANVHVSTSESIGPASDAAHARANAKADANADAGASLLAVNMKLNVLKTARKYEALVDTIMDITTDNNSHKAHVGKTKGEEIHMNETGAQLHVRELRNSLSVSRDRSTDDSAVAGDQWFMHQLHRFDVSDRTVDGHDGGDAALED
jgi:hypothetical protein